MEQLDWTDEQREMAYVRMMAQKAQIERNYNKKAKLRSFKVGDYVLRAATPATRDPREGKLGPNWEGPYQVIADAGKGAYTLQTMEGKKLDNNWNVSHLKPYYF